NQPSKRVLPSGPFQPGISLFPTHEESRCTFLQKAWSRLWAEPVCATSLECRAAPWGRHRRASAMPSACDRVQIRTYSAHQPETAAFHKSRKRFHRGWIPYQETYLRSLRAPSLHRLPCVLSVDPYSTRRGRLQTGQSLEVGQSEDR